MESHSYNTRSRRRVYPEARDTSPSRRRRQIVDSTGVFQTSEGHLPDRRSGRSSTSSSSSDTSPCAPKLLFNNAPCTQRLVRYARIGLLVGLLFLFVWYSSDRTYHVLRQELDTLNCHINNMEGVLSKASNKKGNMEKQLEEISETLPEIKEMAKTLREDVDRCRGPKEACGGGRCDMLRNLIKEELEQYNADKTGLTDFALESSGGQVLHIRDTKPFIGTSAPSLSLFGIPLCQSTNSPRSLIQPGVMPGECWAFKGATGSAVVKLVKPISVTGVSIEHISRKISPTGSANTAPKEFSVYGLEKQTDSGGFFFGKYHYNVNGPSVQYFPVKHKSSNKFEIIELKIHSNHGHSEYTCVYRLRVHGDSSGSGSCS